VRSSVTRFVSAIVSALSLRDIEDILAYRGIEVSHQTIHEWEQWICPLSADIIRLYRPRLSRHSYRHARNDAFDLSNEFSNDLLGA